MRNRSGISPAPNKWGSGICTPVKRWRGKGHALQEARITAAKRQPGRKRGVWMELHSHARSQKNKCRLSDGILGLPTELHIERGRKEINAAINCSFLSTNKLSIVRLPTSSANRKLYLDYGAVSRLVLGGLHQGTKLGLVSQ